MLSQQQVSALAFASCLANQIELQPKTTARRVATELLATEAMDRSLDSSWDTRTQRSMLRGALDRLCEQYRDEPLVESRVAIFRGQLIRHGIEL